MGKFNKKDEDKTNKTLLEKFAGNTGLTIAIIILSLVLVGGIVYLILLMKKKQTAVALDNFNPSSAINTSVSDLPPVTDSFEAPLPEPVGDFSDTSELAGDFPVGEQMNKYLNSLTSEI